MSDGAASWDDVRRIADEIELKIHLAGMEARDRWKELQPRFAELQDAIARKGERIGDVLSEELTSFGTALRKLRDDVVHAVKD